VAPDQRSDIQIFVSMGRYLHFGHYTARTRRLNARPSTKMTSTNLPLPQHDTARSLTGQPCQSVQINRGGEGYFKGPALRGD